MGYDIGRVFSPETFAMIDRARDRAAAHPGSVHRERRVETGLQEAMIRAAQQDREAALRHDLGLATLDATRGRYAEQASLGRAREERLGANDAAELARKSAADEATATYRSGLLETRKAEGSARERRFAERGAYERGVLDVRNREADASASRAETAAETAALRAQAEHVRSVRDARRLLMDARDRASKPNPKTGEVDPERAAAFVGLIHDLESFLRGQKGMPEDVSGYAREARAGVASAAGMGGLGDDEEPDPLLDLGLDEGDEEDRAPRFGR